MALIDFYHSLLFLSFVSAIVGLAWYMVTAKWWVFLLGRAIVSELAGYAIISGFLSWLVVSPHTVPIYVAGIIYGIEAAVHVLLAWAIAKSATLAGRMKKAERSNK